MLERGHHRGLGGAVSPPGVGMRRGVHPTEVTTRRGVLDGGHPSTHPLAGGQHRSHSLMLMMMRRGDGPALRRVLSVSHVAPSVGTPRCSLGIGMPHPASHVGYTAAGSKLLLDHLVGVSLLLRGRLNLLEKGERGSLGDLIEDLRGCHGGSCREARMNPGLGRIHWVPMPALGLEGVEARPAVDAYLL